MTAQIYAALVQELGDPLTLSRPEPRHALLDTQEWVPDWSVALPVHGTDRKAG